MHHKVEIISLKKNEFIYKKINKKRRALVYSFALIGVLSLLTITGKVFLTKAEDQVLMSALNPIYSPYVQTGNTVFTNAYQLESKELNFVAPVNFKDYEIYNNEIVFGRKNTKNRSAVAYFSKFCYFNSARKIFFFSCIINMNW